MKKTLFCRLCICTACIATGLPMTCISEVNGGQNEFIDMDISQLMNITITSVSKRPQNLSDAAAAVFVISADDIKNSGVTTVADALAMAPGLQVAQISSSKWSVSSRGFSGYTSSKLLILIDGRSVYSPAYGGSYWDQQNVMLEDIERIEVIRGPGGTLWGANAVNGVINIITKKAEDTQGVMLTAGGGNQERIMSGARIGGKIGDSTYGRLSLSYNEREENSLAFSDLDAGDGWESMRGSFRLDGEQSRKGKWTVQGDLYKNDEDEITSSFWTTPPIRSLLYGSIEDEGANILGRYEHEFNDDNILTVQTYYDYTDRSSLIHQQTFNVYDLDLQYQMGIGQINSLTMGMGFRQTKGDFTNTEQISMADRTDDLYSTFLQDEITLLPDSLWFTLGTKWEYNDYTGSEWQPSARILWKPAVNHSLWSSVARAVRTPTVVETEGGSVLYAVVPTEFGFMQSRLVGNENFDAEELIAYEAGYRWQSSLNVSLDLAVFYNDYDDIYTFSAEPPATGIDVTLVNGISGNSHGLEAVVDWNPADWVSFQAVYSYINMDFEVNNVSASTVSSDTVSGYVESSSPQHQVSLRSSFNVTKDWTLNLWLRYVDDIVVLNSGNSIGGELSLDDYFLLDANITWAVSENVEFTIAGTNLLEERQLQYVSEYVTPPTEIERGFYGKVTWSF